MTDINPKPGERWRVTIEGEITDASGVWVDLGSQCFKVSEGAWERLPDPEPEWQPGNLVLDAAGDIWRRRPADAEKADRYPWEMVGDGWYPESDPVRPLTRLVREK